MISKGVITLTLALCVYWCSGIQAFSFGDLIPSYVIDQNPEDIHFYLFPTKQNLNRTDELIIGNLASFQQSPYNSSRPVIIIIHGFISESNSTFEQSLKDAYLEEDTEANIVLVDWSTLATPKSSIFLAFYELAVQNVPKVGKKVSDLIIYLLDQKLLSGPEGVHIVGHSLGAQAGGQCGRLFSLQRNGDKIGRITGLDPAGPSYTWASENTKLNVGDARFVDVIHTNAAELGYYGNMGDIDFWVNGGLWQPQCPLISSVTTGECDHEASYKYFAKSIREKDIVACFCDKYFPDDSCMDPCVNPVIFGEHCPQDARGAYYLNITY